MRGEFDRQEYEEQVLKEVTEEMEGDDPVKQRINSVSFISRSAGKGRRRNPRHVELLVVDGDYAHVVEDHEIKPRKNGDHVAIDVLAEEVLSHLPKEKRTAETLLYQARK